MTDVMRHVLFTVGYLSISMIILFTVFILEVRDHMKMGLSRDKAVEEVDVWDLFPVVVFWPFVLVCLGTMALYKALSKFFKKHVIGIFLPKEAGEELPQEEDVLSRLSDELRTRL